MKKYISLSVIEVLVIFIGAIVTGTLIWGLWDHVIPYFFQFAIDAGLPESPEWWPCVLLSWFIGALKSTSTTNSD